MILPEPRPDDRCAVCGLNRDHVDRTGVGCFDPDDFADSPLGAYPGPARDGHDFHPAAEAVAMAARP